MLELAPIWLRDDHAIAALVAEVRGFEIVERARAAGRGVIYMTPHLGCFELAGRWVGSLAPLTVLYRPPKIASLEPVMIRGRQRGQVKLATTDLAGVRKLIRALRSHEAVGLLPDQVPGSGEGEWAPLFGRPAYTMTLATRLAESTGAPIVFVFAERLGGARGYRITLSELPPARAGESATARLNRAVESLIEQRPTQYLWSYNRYKVPAGAEPPPGAA